MNHRLLLRQSPRLRIDARALSRVALSSLSIDDVRRLTLPHGRDQLPVAELFDVLPPAEGAGPSLVIEGDLSRFDAIGAGLTGGVIEIVGPVGDAAGLGMTGGTLTVHGRAGDLTGCSMRGGWLEVIGDIGDFAASAMPGDMDGMRGGTLVVRGNAGERLADRMRRGTVAVFGDAGDFMASRMVAGTIALAGRCGAHPAWGMRRGTLVLAGPAPTPASTFVPVRSNAEVFWRLLTNDLARFGGPFESLAARRIERFAGDIGVQGKGELLFVR
ncbi:MAG TPA: formylmethanofuran dehydrogenase subunit C [Burkholderiaceae bacterium]|nr:formylmethanofuran dehydrogenase subunit C [Burkholderiaceae bacterium]